jgi:hypothetical protein
MSSPSNELNVNQKKIYGINRTNINITNFSVQEHVEKHLWIPNS